MTKCPKCESIITSLRIQNLDANQNFSTTRWHCVAYTCPACSTLLSVQIDPIAVKSDIVNELLQRLKGGR